jgi:hypothetical protein
MMDVEAWTEEPRRTKADYGCRHIGTSTSASLHRIRPYWPSQDNH